MLDPNNLSKIMPWTANKDNLFDLYHSSESGLPVNEAATRLEVFGLNEISQKSELPIFVEFFSKFLDPLILILLFASVVSAVLGEVVNFVIIFVMISMSVILDFYQEHTAATAAAKLRRKVSLRSSVIRSGHKAEIDADKLVPGDLITLTAGDVVPADGRIIDCRDLLVNQSTLTGESFPQEKNSQTIANAAATISEIDNMVFMGTSVLQGEATVLITATNKFTRLGQIAKNLTNERPPTEFETGARNFGIFLMRLTFILVIFVFIVNAVFKHDLLNSFLFALALAVGLTPELLPIVITVNLSRGATRMAKKGVIVKNLPSIQNLGGMQILCTDKTGTLTEDKIRLEYYEDVHAKKSDRVLELGFVNSFYQAGLKNPMENAILTHHEVDLKNYQKVDEVPFDFVRKRLSVVVKSGKVLKLITKGTPEGLLSLSKNYVSDGKLHPFTRTIQAKIQSRFKDLSQQGFRVLAVATKTVKAKKEFVESDEKDLTFVGLMAFLDPPKPEVNAAISTLINHGIEVKVLTGDNELVTEKICRDIGLTIKGIVLGEKLSNLTSDELFNVAKNNTIFARLNPDQKEKLILTMKRHGLGVGFLGDGINDAPSLRAADVGISVDNAVDVAREAGDLILLKKDLLVLKDGIIEGRKTFANVMKYIMMGTSSNFGNMVSVAIVSMFLPFLPMLPIQILLNNFLYDTSQIFLSGDNVDMTETEKPVRWNIHFIRKFTLIFGPISSLFDFLTFGLMLFVFHSSMPLFHTGWFIESLVTQTLIIFSIRTTVQPFFKSHPSKPLLISSLVIILFALVTPYISPLARTFGFVIPPKEFYLFLAVFVVAYFFLVEKTKHLFYAHLRANQKDVFAK